MCLPSNYIGIRGTCDGAQPVSGLYINDLQGISISRAAGVTDEVYLRGIDFLRSNETLAYELVKNDFKTKMAQTFIMNTIIDTMDRKISFSAGSYLPLEPGRRFVKITDRLCDTMAKLRINSIQLYARNDWNGFTFDVIDGANTTTHTANLRAGLNTIKLSVIAESGAAYIAYDADQVELWEPECFSIDCKLDRCCDWSCDNYILANYYTGTDLTDLVQLRNKVGIAVNASLICDIDHVFCQYLDVFKFAIWNKMGILIVEKYLSSDRFNPVAFAAKQDAARLLTQWKGGIDTDGFEVKSEYWKLFTSAWKQVESHLKTLTTVCFDCTSLRFVHQIP